MTKPAAKYEIERKFLVRDANFDGVELTLKDIHAVYLDVEAINNLDLPGLPKLASPDLGRHEARIRQVITNGVTEYWFTSKVGERGIKRAETEEPIDVDMFNKFKEKFGIREIIKKRFVFTYLRREFELDVFPATRTMILEVELDDEKQMFAVPPFVDIIKGVTDDTSYYNFNMAQPIEKD